MCVVNKIYVSSVVRTVSSFERFQNFVQESRVEFRPKSEGLLFYEPRDLPDTPGARECSLSVREAFDFASEGLLVSVV
jgi:hypothetical protein